MVQMVIAREGGGVNCGKWARFTDICVYTYNDLHNFHQKRKIHILSYNKLCYMAWPGA